MTLSLSYLRSYLSPAHNPVSLLPTIPSLSCPQSRLSPARDPIFLLFAVSLLSAVFDPYNGIVHSGFLHKFPSQHNFLSFHFFFSLKDCLASIFPQTSPGHFRLLRANFLSLWSGFIVNSSHWIKVPCKDAMDSTPQSQEDLGQ
jgi:hypothetical protein